PWRRGREPAWRRPPRPRLQRNSDERAHWSLRRARTGCVPASRYYFGRDDGVAPRPPLRHCGPDGPQEERMAVAITRRDYSLIGRDTKLAEENGLATAQWYACPVPRKELKALMRRTDGPAIRDTLIWFAAFAVSGTLGYLAWGTWWAVPCFLV